MANGACNNPADLSIWNNGGKESAVKDLLGCKGHCGTDSSCYSGCMG